MTLLSEIPLKLTHFNLFVDSRGYAGTIKELTLPKLTMKVEEHRGGGMDMPVPVDMGMEKLEAEFTMAEYDVNILRQFGFKISGPISLTARGSMRRPDAVVPLSVKMSGVITELDMGTWKPGDDMPLKFKVFCSYYLLKVAEIPVIEIDADNFIRKIGTEDQLLGVRVALLR